MYKINSLTTKTVKSGLDETLAQTSFGDSLVSNRARAAIRQIITNTKETATANELCKLKRPL